MVPTMRREISFVSQDQQYQGTLGTDTEREIEGSSRHSSLQTLCYHLRVTETLKAQWYYRRTDLDHSSRVVI